MSTISVTWRNGDERLVVINRIASSVIEACRRTHPEFVFTFGGHPVTRMMTSAWVRARTPTELHQVRVHDLKHTFGRVYERPASALKTAMIF